jgi:phage repressor protein C with HTH and peptisase S24 domain
MLLTPILEKLKLSIKTDIGRDVKDVDMATALGMSKAQFSNMQRKEIVPYKNIVAYCGQKKINLNWIFFDQDIETIAESSNRLMRIKYYPNIYASCGGGAFNEEEEKDEGSEFIYLDREIVNSFSMISDNPSRYEAIRIVGDSMEPTIKDGGIAIIDRERTNIKGDICAVVTTGGVFVKKIVLSTKGMIDLISHNPLYPKETFNVDEVRVLGRVVGAV